MKFKMKVIMYAKLRIEEILWLLVLILLELDVNSSVIYELN